MFTDDCNVSKTKCDHLYCSCLASRNRFLSHIWSFNAKNMEVSVNTHRFKNICIYLYIDNSVCIYIYTQIQYVYFYKFYSKILLFTANTNV